MRRCVAVLSVAGREQGRLAEADRQQDRVCSARLRGRARSELREGASRVCRGADLQGLHVQLGPQVHEQRHTARRRRLPTLLQGRLRDRPQKVRRYPSQRLDLFLVLFKDASLYCVSAYCYRPSSVVCRSVCLSQKPLNRSRCRPCVAAMQPFVK